MAEELPNNPSTVSSKWYKYGADVFFSVPQDVLQALLADPAFATLELLSEHKLERKYISTKDFSEYLLRVKTPANTLNMMKRAC